MENELSLLTFIKRDFVWVLHVILHLTFIIENSTHDF